MFLSKYNANSKQIFIQIQYCPFNPNMSPDNVSTLKCIKTKHPFFYQSKDDGKKLDPTYTPLAAEKKQKKFENNETLMLVMLVYQPDCVVNLNVTI